MLFGVFILSDDSVNDSLDDVLFRNDTVHIFNKLVCFLRLIILEVVDDEVKSGLRDDINQGREHLLGVLSTTEDNQIMAQKIVIN